MSDASRKRRGMTIALILSLGLNLVIIGTVAGAVLRDGGHPVRTGVAPDLRAAISALPTTGRDRVREAMRSAMPNNRSDRVERLHSGRRFAAAVRAEPIERAIIEQIFAQRANVADQLRQAAQGALIDALAEMPATQRAEFLQQLQQPPRERNDRRDGAEQNRPPRD